MNIAINTRFLLPRKMEGFGWFTYEITRHIVLAHPEHTFYFFFDRAYDKRFVFSDNVVPVVLSPQARHPILFKIWFNYSVTQALNKYKIDLFFSPDGYLSLKTKVKQIGVIHDLNFEHFPQDIPKSPRRYLLKYFKQFAQKASHIITVSNYSKKDIVNLYGVDENKITVAYNGSSDHFKLQPESVKLEIRSKYTSGQEYFVYVGAIHPRKNVERLIEAYHRFKLKTKSETKLLIVGENLWGSDVNQSADDIIYTGHVQIEELAKIVGSAKALCLVSYFEGFGIPLVEAMQSGVPLLSGNLTALPEVAGGAAVLVDPFSIESIRDGMEDLDNDQELRDRLIKKGLERSKLFNWEQSAKVIWNEIEILLKK